MKNVRPMAAAKAKMEARMTRQLFFFQGAHVLGYAVGHGTLGVGQKILDGAAYGLKAVVLQQGIQIGAAAFFFQKGAAQIHV